MATVPVPIQRAVLLIQEKVYDWPRLVPAFAFMPPHETTVKRYDNLTLADCEQLVEHHVRQAKRYIARWWRCDPQRPDQVPVSLTRIENRRNHYAKCAADAIVKSRIYRCRYLQLLIDAGQLELEQTSEADLPFPDWHYDEVEEAVR